MLVEEDNNNYNNDCSPESLKTSDNTPPEVDIELREVFKSLVSQGFRFTDYHEN
jgi:hypothetical protein